MGTLRRTTPLSSGWGFDRGRPVDRYYIDGFLERHQQDIHGRVLEILNSNYTDRYGSGIERTDILDIDPANPLATIIADLAAADSINSDLFDCFILTQTLQLIYDVKSAIAHAHRILRPGGVLLVTIPAVSRLAGEGYTDYWRFTPDSCTRLFGEIFGADQVTVYSYGNVLTAVAFLQGMACEELSKRELDVKDERYPVLLAIRAVKK
jgi:SAM-dependent methyltransferase